MPIRVGQEPCVERDKDWPYPCDHHHHHHAGGDAADHLGLIVVVDSRTNMAKMTIVRLVLVVLGVSETMESRVPNV